jgi:hypothetical protein
MQRRNFFRLGITGISTFLFANNALALKYYPKPSEKKWAVLYGTWCGTARDAGTWISEGMGGIADVFDVHENVDLQKFDNIVIGGAIRGDKVTPELETYIKNNQEWLKNKVKGLFIVCGNMQRPVTPELIERHINKYLAPLCGVKNVPANVFLGRITPALLEEDIRKMMSQMGEYDNLKRTECMLLGREILNTATKNK